jgi:hypothetical protein
LNVAASKQHANAAANADTSMTGFGDPFADVNASDLGPALEIEPIAAHISKAPARPAPTPEAAATVQARKIAQIARYGPAPKKLLQAVPYFFRVARRKRAIEIDLAAQVSQRKRLEAKADESVCALGEALYAQRNDPRLAVLMPQIRAVNEARDQIGSSAAAGKRVVLARRRELDGLAQRCEQIKQQADPVERRADQLTDRIEAGRAQIRGLEQQMRKLEAEQKLLKASTQTTDLEQIAALETQREAFWGESQSLHVELLPLSEDLATLKAELAGHMQAMSQLNDQQRKITEAADRDEQRQLIAAGGARSALREALRSLASAAVRNQLGQFAPAALSGAIASETPIANQRQHEDLVRKALSSYDAAAYRRGMQLVAGAILGTFLLFVLLIAF